MQKDYLPWDMDTQAIVGGVTKNDQRTTHNAGVVTLSAPRSSNSNEYCTLGFLNQFVEDLENKQKNLNEKFLEVIETKNSWGKNQLKEAFLTIMSGMDYDG